jgi:8-oxo-dGTP diphosphatase
MTINRFNLRVYGLIINEKNEVLLTDEYFRDMRMTKFPGGGLEFGEGTLDCLKREAMEEFGQKVEVLEHFYTTDFFQPALFYADTQLISIYYRMKFKEPVRFRISTKPFDFNELKNGSISFRWKAIRELSADDFTFPVDKHVVFLLKDKFKNVDTLMCQ